MTYSQQIKVELCNTKLTCENCQKAMVYGMLLTSKAVSNNSIVINTENKAIADVLIHGIIDLTGAIVTVQNPDLRERKKRPLYTITIEDKEDIENIINFFFNGQVDKLNINFNLIENECCAIAFLRGAFFICGTMINPNNEYHFEYSMLNESICNQFLNLLSEFELDFKKTIRNKNYILYVKDSQQIEDTLTCLGAVQSSMALMNLKIEKELRNKVNRRTNCETANIGKTVNAAMLQIQKIEHIKNKKGLDILPIELKQVALLRLENPDMSLSELCDVADNKISRSGLNHRLKKICTIADSIDN